MSDSILPPDWQVVPFGKLATFRNGINFTRENGDTDVKMVGVGDFGTRTTIEDLSKIRFVHVADADIRDDDYLQDGDLLFVRSNGNKALIGRCVSVHPNGELVTFSGFTIRARIADDRLDRGFARRLFTSELFRRRLHEQGGGTNISNLNQRLLSDFPVVLPPRSVQEELENCFVVWDRAIAVADALLAARRLQFSWFRSKVLTGSVRYNGFSTPWQPERLASVLFEHGSRSTGAEPVYSVSVHLGLVDQVEHLGRSFAASQTGHYNLVRPGDIVYTKSPTGDFPLGIIKQSKASREVIVSPLYAVFTPKSHDLGVILDAYFSSPAATERYLAPLVQKGAKNTMSITNQQFLQGTVVLPTDEQEVRLLAELTNFSLAEMRKLESYADLLRRQSRGLMQKLLAGEWRLGEAHEEAAE